jgi:hypothetical protein
MANELWQSDTIDLDDKVEGDTQASDQGVVLRFHDGRWIFEMHMAIEPALALRAAMDEAIIQSRSMGAI